jgi:hypothetical protein
MKTALGIATAAVVLSGGLREAGAWRTELCNSQQRGLRDATVFKLNRCSIPAGSEREQAIKYSREQWAFISGTRLSSRIQLGSGSTTCSVSHNDGQFDVAFTARSNINNAAGSTKIRFAPCSTFWHTGEIIEADVLIADDLPLPRVAFDSTTLGARETAIHEFGHALGMFHETGRMSVMCPTDTCGKLAEHFYWGQLAYGAESVFPDDVDFARVYYGNVPGDPGRPDLAASVWQYSSGVASRIYSSVTTLTRCPGQSATVRLSHGNKGVVNVTSTSPMEARVVLSTDSTIGTDDYAVGYWNIWGNTGLFDTNDFTFTVPSISNGTYYIGFIINGNAAFSEDTLGNNAVYSRRRLKIQTACP